MGSTVLWMPFYSEEYVPFRMCFYVFVCIDAHIMHEYIYKHIYISLLFYFPSYMNNNWIIIKVKGKSSPVQNIHIYLYYIYISLGQQSVYLTVLCFSVCSSEQQKRNCWSMIHSFFWFSVFRGKKNVKVQI